MGYLNYQLITMVKCVLRFLLNRIFGESVELHWSCHEQNNGLDLSVTPSFSARLRELSMRCWRNHDQPRRYLQPELSVADFFRALDAAGIRYIVLRWFETLPQVLPGEDIDLLVADEDVNKLEKWLLPYYVKDTQAFDIYSVSGVPGTLYRKALPYYPAVFADRLLAQRMRWRKCCSVPHPQDYWLSLAFHLVYHKAERSGLPVHPGERPPVSHPEHDYRAALQHIGEGAGREMPASLSELHQILQTEIHPPVDYLRKLAEGNSPWLMQQFPPDSAAFWPEDAHSGAQVCVFLVREWARQHGIIDLIRKTLFREGFEFIEDTPLSDEQMERCKHRLRSGNWQRGPFPENGGAPVHVFVALDQTPEAPTPALLAAQPFLVNARTQRVKLALRERVNALLPPARQVNFLHTSDDHREARAHLQVLFPGRMAEIAAKISDAVTAFQTGETVERRLSANERRAKVERVRWQGMTVVKKTFKSGRERFLQREVRMLTELTASGAPVPRLLESGSNYFIAEYIEQNKSADAPLTKPVISEMRQILEMLFERGYAHLDFKPESILWNSERLLAVIDFEFCQPYYNRPAHFSDSYDLTGAPPQFSGDLPIGGQPFIDRAWRKRTGKTLKTLLKS